jgi:hypothetical protein
VHALIGGAIALNCGVGVAQVLPLEMQGKPLPTYKHDPSDCYVNLRRQWPYVPGGNYPVCRAIAKELNRSCNEPPQYDERRFRSTPEGITLPNWQPLDAVSNLDLVKHVQWASATPESMEANWALKGAQAKEKAASGTLKLFRATVNGLDFRGGTYTAYRVEVSVPEDGPGYNQPRLMISELGKQNPSEMFRSLHTCALKHSELFQFKGEWFVFGFDLFNRRFVVSEFTWSGRRDDSVGIRAVCSLQHVSDRTERNQHGH